MSYLVNPPATPAAEELVHGGTYFRDSTAQNVGWITFEHPKSPTLSITLELRGEQDGRDIAARLQELLRDWGQCK